MSDQAIQRFISGLKLTKFPYFTTETQVVFGRVTLTATPSIDSKHVHSLRLDLPTNIQPNEMAYCLLFFVSVWSPEVASRIISERHGAEHVEVIGDWLLRTFIEDRHPVFLAESIIFESE